MYPSGTVFFLGCDDVWVLEVDASSCECVVTVDVCDCECPARNVLGGLAMSVSSGSNVSIAGLSLWYVVIGTRVVSLNELDYSTNLEAK